MFYLSQKLVLTKLLKDSLRSILLLCFHKSKIEPIPAIHRIFMQVVGIGGF